MSIDIGFSLSNDFLREAYKNQRHGEESEVTDFVEYVAEGDFPVEMYLSSGDMVETASNVEPAKKYVDHFGLDVEGLHLTRLYELGSQDGERELRTRVYNTQTSNKDALPMFSPSTITFHPPKYDDLEDVSRADVRRNAVEAMGNVQEWIDNDDRFTGQLAVENVISPQRYVIETPADVEQLQELADNTAANFQYTLDNGHADEPVEMAEAMGTDIANIHLHDRTAETDRQRDYLRDQYGIPETEEVGTSGERQGELTHIPPGAGQTDIEGLIQELERLDYDGNLMLEVHPSYARFGHEELAEDVDELREMI